MKKSELIFLGAVLMVAPHSGFPAAIVDGFNLSALPANDDEYVKVALPFAVSIFGTTYTSTYVSNNGNLTFKEAMAGYTPLDLTAVAVDQPIIAPFFADVDTRGADSALTRYGNGSFDGHTAFGATWSGVGYYRAATDKLNKFQTLLVDRSETGVGNFDFYFNYDQIQWESGDMSDGSEGLGGYSARAGFSLAGPDYSFEIWGSGINGAFLDTNLTTGLIYGGNTNVAGRYLFEVRNDSIVIPPPPNAVPESGSTLALLSLALLTLSGTLLLKPQ